MLLFTGVKIAIYTGLCKTRITLCVSSVILKDCFMSHCASSREVTQQRCSVSQTAWRLSLAGHTNIKRAYFTQKHMPLKQRWQRRKGHIRCLCYQINSASLLFHMFLRLAVVGNVDTIVALYSSHFLGLFSLVKC